MADIRLQEGPQRTAAASLADVIFYGGAKGCGKSFWLAFDSAKWFDLPGHSSIIFRRTSPELRGPGSMWEETLGLYPQLGGTPIESRMEWRFPSTSTVVLRHLQHVKDAYAWNGKNIGDIGLDELTFFEEEQFWILMSCQRASMGGWQARPRIRATMNPDPDSWIYNPNSAKGGAGAEKFVDWYIGEDGYFIPERRGVVRWFGRVDGNLRWYGSEEDARRAGIRTPKSFTFIGATIFDNPALLAKRSEYLANLEALPPVEQARYLGGNWRVRAQAGDYFRQEWFPIRGVGPLAWKLEDHPRDTDILRKWRMWDLAGTPWKGDTFDPATPAREEGDEPDWTRGLLVGVTRRREQPLVLLDMVGWRDSPGVIEEAMIATAKQDGSDVEVCVGHDPGQAGIYQIEALERSIRKRARIKRFTAVRATKGKEEYASVASRVAHRGLILVQRGAWNEEFFREIEAFPRKDAKRDQVDVLSQSVMHWLETGGDFRGVQSVGASRAERTLNLDARRIGDLLLP